jgi:hypothetical protein
VCCVPGAWPQLLLRRAMRRAAAAGCGCAVAACLLLLAAAGFDLLHSTGLFLSASGAEPSRLGIPGYLQPHMNPYWQLSAQSYTADAREPYDTRSTQHVTVLGQGCVAGMGVIRHSRVLSSVSQILETAPRSTPHAQKGARQVFASWGYLSKRSRASKNGAINTCREKT